MNEHQTVVLLFQGKTLTMIAVILTNFHDGKSLPVERKSGPLKEVRLIFSNLKSVAIINIIVS